MLVVRSEIVANNLLALRIITIHPGTPGYSRVHPGTPVGFWGLGGRQPPKEGGLADGPYQAFCFLWIVRLGETTRRTW